MKMAVFGDMHGSPDWALKIIDLAEPDACIQTGDYWCYDTPWPIPFYWIAGNHEQPNTVEKIEAGTYELPRNNIMLKGGWIHEICGRRVLPLPAKIKMGGAPGPAAFMHEDYERCLRHAGQKIDILLSHGCGFRFVCNSFGKTIDCEEGKITEMVCRIRPQIAISGHNHKFEDKAYDGIRCIRMGVCRSMCNGAMILTDEDFQDRQS
jgi:predicted phosphodiesterase